MSCREIDTTNQVHSHQLWGAHVLYVMTQATCHKSLTEDSHQSVSGLMPLCAVHLFELPSGPITLEVTPEGQKPPSATTAPSTCSGLLSKISGPSDKFSHNCAKSLRPHEKDKTHPSTEAGPSKRHKPHRTSRRTTVADVSDVDE